MGTARSCGFLLSVVVGCLALAACSSTQLVNQWSNPAYSGPAFKKVMVVGVTRQAAIRRSFEDAFVAQLKAAGVNATASYPYIPQDGPVAEAVLKQAVKEAAVDGVIITRLVRVQQQTVVSPGYDVSDPAMVMHSFYTTAFNTNYEPPVVYHEEIYTCETTLYDAAKSQVVWRGTAQTTSLGDIDKEIQNYAEIMIRALKDKQLI
jgi:hypothetical protein